MKLRTIIKYSSNRTLHRLLICFLTVMLSYVMFLLLLASWFMWGYVVHERHLCNKCLTGGIKQCGMILFESGNTNNPDFLSEICEMEELVGFTSGELYQVPSGELGKYSEQQEELDSELFEATGFTSMFEMNQSGINVCQFQLREGKYPDEWELAEDERLIYFGGNFQNVTVGEKMESSLEAVTYVVGGVLEPGSNWICDDIYVFESIQDSHYVQCLDNMVVCLQPYRTSNRNTYCVKNGYQLEDVEAKLLKIAEKFDVGIKLARLNDVIQENEYQLSYVINMIRLLTVIIIITALIVLERTQYSEIINDTEYLGIFFANGASMRDMIAILLGENLIKVSISFALAAFTGYYIVKLQWNIFQPGIDQWKTARDVYFGQAMLPSMVIGVGMVVLATIRSIRWLKQKNPAELLREYKV